MTDEGFDAAYWEYTALTRKRFWIAKREKYDDIKWWENLIYIGGDEYWRWTIVIGPLVVALWRMPEWQGRVASLQKTLEEDDV